MASDTEPRMKFSPRAMLTHSEAIIDFLNMPADSDVTVNIRGPIAQPYWASLKTDRWGNTQLIWRTQAAGDYTLRVRGDDVDLSEDFTVSYQAGEEDLIARGIMARDADVKSVEEPGKMGDTPSTEARAPEDPELTNPVFATAKGPTETDDEPKPKAAKSKRSRSK